MKGLIMVNSLGLGFSRTPMLQCSKTAQDVTRHSHSILTWPIGLDFATLIKCFFLFDQSIFHE